ncbi:MAG: hypothetical protein AB1491_13225 [Thermodesulfobacteriota bacterium]
MAKTLVNKTVLLILISLFIISGAGLGRAATLTGSTLRLAIEAAKGKNPTLEERRALATVTDTLTPAIFRKLGIDPATAPREDVQELKEVSRLSLRTLDVMTENDPAALSRVALDDLLSISRAVMTKIKEMKITDANLKDERFLQETFFPAVIDELAKPR